MFQFFRRFIDRHASPIGIDLGSQTVKAVQVERIGPGEGPAGWRVAAAGAARVPAGTWSHPAARRAFFAGTVRRMIDGGGFRGRRAVLALPAAATFVTGLRLPPMPSCCVGDAVAQAVAGSLPFPVSQAVVKHVIAGDVYERGELRQSVVVMAVRRALVEECLDAVAAAGLRLTALTAEPLALIATSSQGQATARSGEGTHLIVDLGAADTRVYAARDGRLVFARRLGTSRSDRAAALGGAAPSEAAVRRMAGELQMCRNYVETCQGGTVSDATFAGGGARLRTTCQQLAAALGVRARVAEPLAAPRGSDDTGPEWLVATGTAMGASQGLHSADAAACGRQDRLLAASGPSSPVASTSRSAA